MSYVVNKLTVSHFRTNRISIYNKKQLRLLTQEYLSKITNVARFHNRSGPRSIPKLILQPQVLVTNRLARIKKPSTKTKRGDRSITAFKFHLRLLRPFGGAEFQNVATIFFIVFFFVIQ